LCGCSHACQLSGCPLHEQLRMPGLELQMFLSARVYGSKGAAQGPAASCAGTLGHGLVIPCMQVEVENPELYQYDGDVIAKAEEMGKPGLVDIRQRTVGCDEASAAGRGQGDVALLGWSTCARKWVDGRSCYCSGARRYVHARGCWACV
jgi:hypothetical protein